MIREVQEGVEQEVGCEVAESDAIVLSACSNLFFCHDSLLLLSFLRSLPAWETRTRSKSQHHYSSSDECTIRMSVRLHTKFILTISICQLEVKVRKYIYVYVCMNAHTFSSNLILRRVILQHL